MQDEVVDFLKMPNSLYKNVLYYRNFMSRHASEAEILYKDDSVHYAYTTYAVKKSKSGYYRQAVKKEGFTIKNNKLSIWFGKNIFELQSIRLVLDHFKCNWLHAGLIPYITKSIAEKIFIGKITNNTEVCKAYLKVMRFKDASPKLFLDVLTGNNTQNKQNLLRAMSVAKDVNHFFEWMINVQTNKYSGQSIISSQQEYLVFDMIQQALTLDKKIDFKWSEKRLTEEHNQWTKIIMDIEGEHMEDAIVESILPYDKFNYPGFKLLKTQKEVYFEGKLMKHCVYTNYWNSIKYGNYLAYAVEQDGERATLGLNIHDGKIVYNQCYSVGNSSVSASLKTSVEHMIVLLNSFARANMLIRKQEFEHIG